ncbi:hypothetical protein [uncultured Thiocystis sp.]|uniref:hypothetical protein n=1 Tax=uncultured Thiocystis sp. TaxID=1202134 RepID=UPI0025E0FD52|nr:hypothetical protein [uncultured Thiocystis sp.]
MRPITTLAALPALFLLSSAFAGGYPLKIDSDTKAEYVVVEKAGTPEQPTLLLMRVRAGATSYSKRLFDCAAQSYKHLGSGESIEAVAESHPDDALVPAKEGMIAYQLWKHACGK